MGLALSAGCGKNSTQGMLGDTRSPALDPQRQLPQGTPKPIVTPKPADTAPSPAPQTNPAKTTKPAPKTFSIAIKNFAYSPSTLYIERGTIVTWINYDSVQHTVTGDAGGPASGTLTAGKRYSYTFNELGTFPYHSASNANMKGTIIVTPTK